MGGKTITLSDGRELTIDLYAISMREYRNLFDKDGTQEEADKTIAKAWGLTVDEYLDLPQPDALLVFNGFFEVNARSLADPNSPSVSTSPAQA